MIKMVLYLYLSLNLLSKLTPKVNRTYTAVICREHRSAFPTKITVNDIGVYQNICVNIDYLSNSFSISFISSHKWEILTSGSTYIFLFRLFKIKASHALRRSVFASSSAFSQKFNFSPLVLSIRALVMPLAISTSTVKTPIFILSVLSFQGIQTASVFRPMASNFRFQCNHPPHCRSIF